MAKIDWTVKFLKQLDANINYASIEFGHSTAIKWAEEELYRRCHIMHRRFKIIYYYDETKDIIHLVDIWDTRMNPKTLVKRIR